MSRVRPRGWHYDRPAGNGNAGLFSPKDMESKSRQLRLILPLVSALLLMALVAVGARFWRGQALSALSPVLRLLPGGAPGSSVSAVGAADPAELRACLAAAHHQLAALRAELAGASDELARLRDALGQHDQLACVAGPEAAKGAIAARVIARPRLWRRDFLIIDRGTADGVTHQAGVVWQGCAAGRVVAEGPNAASVALLVRPEVQIPARVLETRHEGMLVGAGYRRDQAGRPYPACELLYLPREAGIKEGMKVVASGLDGCFVPGTLLGTVRRFLPEGGPFALLEVEAAADLTRLENVLVLRQRLPPLPLPERAGSGGRRAGEERCRARFLPGLGFIWPAL